MTPPVAAGIARWPSPWASTWRRLPDDAEPDAASGGRPKNGPPDDAADRLARARSVAQPEE